MYRGVERLGLPPTRLDYEKLSRKLAAGNHWQGTRYYTGRVTQGMGELRYRNQRYLLNSLARVKGISCHTGSVVPRSPEKAMQRVSSLLKTLSEQGADSFDAAMLKRIEKTYSALDAVRYVEKEVDVMIALDMLALMSRYDVAYLLSADADFIPAVRKVRESGREVVVASCTPRTRLNRAASTFIHLDEGYLAACGGEAVNSSQ